MYVWTAINIDEQLLSVKNAVKEIEKVCCFNHSDVTMLPLHISLKISALVPDEKLDEVVEALAKLFQNVDSFQVETEEVQLNQTIVWIKMKENNSLNHLHQLLNDLFLQKYGVPLHEYDKKFVFHSTLFLDQDLGKICKAFSLIQHQTIPSQLTADRFIIGCSPNGNVGTYTVLKEIRK